MTDKQLRRSRSGQSYARARLQKGSLIATAWAIAFSHGSSAASPSAARHVDLLIKNGFIYDGSGGAPIRGGVAIRGQRVVQLGDVSGWHASQEVDANGLAVAPGFINMLSQAQESLIQDGRSLSDLKQGVTLELIGEGDSMGPLTEYGKAELRKTQVDIHYEVTWNTLGEYLEWLVKRGISTNIGSFVGEATVRADVMGRDDRPPTDDELQRMEALVREAMEEGALGLSSSLIYSPGVYAKSDELTALAVTAAHSGGGYVSHLRSEGDRLLESVDELIGVARSTKGHAEVFHLKAAGKSNWGKMRQAIERIEAARREGLDLSANMYTYPAAATGLDASMPPWVQAGGLDAWIERLKEPDIRRRVAQEMRSSSGGWENYLKGVGTPDHILLVSFKNEGLKSYTGKTLAQVAAIRHQSPEDAAIDLVIEDHTRVGAVYFMMSESNVKLGLSQPWVTLGSDEASQSPEGVFLRSQPHPRAYGTFARFLGRYVRDEHVASLPEAIRRLTQLPAQNWKLRDRGCIKAGCYADIVIFDSRAIADHATFDDPQRFSTGVRDVFVNGKQVLRNGEHTGAKPGEVVRGPGWNGWNTPLTAAAGLQSQVDALFGEWDRPDSPGCALAVMKDGQIAYERGYGMADLSHGIPITPSTPFHVASVSKQFTAAAILLLADQGKVSLDDDVHKYLPELPDFGVRMTLRHLLHHTSGLRDQWELLDLAGFRYSLDLITDADVMNIVTRQKELNFQPGSQYLYSNTGWTLLGQIISRVTRQSLRQFTNEKFFLPLGMRHTHFRDDHAEINPGEAFGYVRSKDGAFKLSVTNFDTVGATSLYTTVEDLAKWDENFYAPTVGGAAFARHMLHTDPLNSGESYPYAMGLMLLQYRGMPVVDHSGADAGFRADLLRFPTEHLSVACLCNTIPSVGASALTRRVADHYLEARFVKPAAEPFVDGARLPLEMRTGKEGVYRLRATGEIMRLSVDDGVLNQIDSSGKTALRVDAAGRFLLPELIDTERFEPAQGEAQRIVEEGDGKPARIWDRLPAVPPSVRHDLLGNYYSEEVDANFSVVDLDGKLVLRRKKNPPDDLTPVAPDLFVTALGVIQFTRNSSGRVCGLLVTTGRVRSLKFARQCSRQPCWK